MKNAFRTAYLLTTGLIAAATLASMAAPADAQVFQSQQRPSGNSREVAYAEVGGTPYTNSTTGYTTVTNLTTAFKPVTDPTVSPGGNANQVASPERLLLSASLDAAKATAGTANCVFNVNGAVLATTARYIAFGATRGEIGMFAEVTPTNNPVTSQTISVQCQSSDTNTLTITNGNMRVVEAY